jgi:hypothetical protein
MRYQEREMVEYIPKYVEETAKKGSLVGCALTIFGLFVFFTLCMFMFLLSLMF